jgi:hypothetical protein
MRKGKVKSFLIIVAALLVAASTIRLFFLPYWLTNHIDRKLDSLPGYRVTYDDYSISLFTASVTLEEVAVVRSENFAPIPLLEAASITAGLDWRALTQGFWVSRIIVDHP